MFFFLVSVGKASRNWDSIKNKKKLAYSLNVTSRRMSVRLWSASAGGSSSKVKSVVSDLELRTLCRASALFCVNHHIQQIPRKNLHGFNRVLFVKHSLFSMSQPICFFFISFAFLKYVSIKSVGCNKRKCNNNEQIAAQRLNDIFYINNYNGMNFFPWEMLMKHEYEWQSKFFEIFRRNWSFGKMENWSSWNKLIYRHNDLDFL